MAQCNDCFNNCQPIISDKCVKYTGPDIECLGIQTGDQLSALEAAMVDKLCTAIDGSGITLSDLTSCTAFTNALGSNDATLYNVIQAILTVLCTVKEDVDELIDESPITLTGDCLDLPESPNRDDILVAVANKVCEVSESIETVSGDYVKSSELCSLVNDCLSSSEDSQEYTKMAKYVALPYHGPLSVFDSSGSGILALGYGQVYICIGQTVNGFTLPDYRGRSPLGANSGIPNSSMDSAVDPTNINNAGYSVSLNTKKGSYTDTLTITQVPAHTHSINDPGHEHTEGYEDTRPGGAGSIPVLHPSTPNNVSTSSNTTGITINSSGGSQSHNTTHPVLGAVFIMYVPS